MALGVRADRSDQEVKVFNKGEDPYNLHVVNGQGNGVTCDDIG